MSKNNIPSIIPIAAGIQLNLPISSDSSIAGIMSDHTEAATMTPAAKPSSALFRRAEMLFFAINTIDAPIAVPRKGIAMIAKIFI